MTRPIIPLLFMALLVGLSGCVNHQMPAPVARYNTLIKKTDTQYIVRKGDTLYSIAWAIGSDYKSLAGWNAIKWPYTIYPGKVIKLKKPRVWVKPVKVKKKEVAANKKPHVNQKLTTNTSNKYKIQLKLRWKWPLQGKQIKRSGSHKGIFIAGKPKQLVRSSERGKVVYAGNGLKGYGNLIIIKHNDEFLSAYGFNKRLLVKEGSIVKRGQAIAEIGLGKREQYVLFFEIRRHGKPVAPTRYLP